MMLLQLTSGQGPIECCKAVGLALKTIERECQAQNIDYSIIEAVGAQQKGCFKSVLIELEATQKAKQFAHHWQGALLWVCQSPFRTKHKRKNWFFSGNLYEVNTQQFDKAIDYQTCRASGAGGQHVNKTDSAVQATHRETGIMVRVESERSQHANKRLATALLLQKLEMLKQTEVSEQDKSRWQQHWEVQRGNPSRTFKGERFTPQD